jgi:hypothetical protein
MKSLEEAFVKVSFEDEQAAPPSGIDDPVYQKWIVENGKGLASLHGPILMHMQPPVLANPQFCLGMSSRWSVWTILNLLVFI